MLLVFGVVKSSFARETAGVETSIAPFLSAELGYDDNVFKDASARDDFFRRYRVGGKFFRKSDLFFVSSDAWLSQRSYDQFSERNESQWSSSLKGRLNGTKTFLSGSFDFREIRDSSDVPSFGSQSGADQLFDRVINDQYSRHYTSKITLGRQVSSDFSVQCFYGYSAVDYEVASLNTWHKNSVGTEGSLRLTDKTSAFLNMEYSLLARDAAESDDTTLSTRLGVAYRPTSKTSIRLGGGMVRYSVSGEDNLKGSFEADINWKAREHVRVFLRGRNAVEPTGINGELALANRIGAGVHVLLTDATAFSASGGVLFDEISRDSGETLSSRQDFGAVRLDYSRGRFKAFSEVNVSVSNSGAAETYVPYSKQKSALVGMSYVLVRDLRLYARTEFSETESGVSEKYSRFRGQLGLQYNF